MGDYTREIKNRWTLEDFKAKIIQVEKDIIALQQQITYCDTKMNIVREEKRILAGKVGKKERYLNLMREHMLENIPDKPIEETPNYYPQNIKPIDHDHPTTP